jgi:hypothetical protein
MRHRTKFLMAGVALLVLPIVMCWRSPLFGDGYMARKDVRLVMDNPEVQRLLGEEETNLAERESFISAGIEARSEFVRHPEQHIPKHFEFFGAIARQPTEEVPKGSYARFLRGSKAPCGIRPDSNVYVKFKITTGPMKEHEGWACNVNDIGPTVAMP